MQLFSSEGDQHFDEDHHEAQVKDIVYDNISQDELDDHDVEHLHCAQEMQLCVPQEGDLCDLPLDGCSCEQVGAQL